MYIFGETIMELSKEIQNFLLKDAKERFLRYVAFDTKSDETTGTHPSTEKQFKLAKELAKELNDIGFKNVEVDDYCYVYGELPASKGFEKSPAIGLIAHMDTSPAESGKDVEPIIHENYDGSGITYPKNDDLVLKPEESPQLLEYKGMNIITASGDTLLGADDKAGIAEIMAAAAAWKKFPKLEHGPITVCFTPDEEIGQGTTKIDLDRLPKQCYTLDGGEMGELEAECFDAWSATITFKGVSVHPGSAKNLMINAIEIACRFVSQIPEQETPQNTEDREGFYHLYKMEGDCVEAKTVFILRDFDKEQNKIRMDYLEKLADTYKIRYPELKIDLNFKHSYENMNVYLKDHPEIIEKAAEAIKAADLPLKRRSIRGGTDGARLSAKGVPTPNIFAGGLMFHSLKEYLPEKALQKAAEVVIYLGKKWTE
jgi:tripeptide aminopeptidase